MCKMSCNGCGNPIKNIIPVFDPPEGSNAKDVIVLAGPGISVDNLSDADTWRYRVNAEEFQALTVELTLVAKELGVAKANPILKGTVIDTVELDWTYNKAINSQTLVNTGGLTPPTLDAADRDNDYATQNIQSNISFTIEGDDGLGQPGSEASDVESIVFGNLMWLGHGLTKIGSSAASLEAFIESLQTSVIKTARAHQYFATGGANQKHFVAYPKAWGLATFTKGIFSGGYVRLKNVGGTLVQDAGVNPETDIIITNSKGYAEAYYIYESLYDNQNDPVTPFVIS
jgi:hypothetical protein